MTIKIRLRRTLLFLWTLSFLCLRPSIFGERYNLLVFIFLFLISFIAIYFFGGNLLRADRKSFNLLIIILVLVSYFFIQGLAMSSNTQVVFNSCFLILSISILSFFMLSTDKIYILKSIIYIHVVLSLSSLVTFLIFLVSGFNTNGLITISILNDFMNTPIPSDGDFFSYHRLFFPYSHSWSSVGIFGKQVPRLLGIYREAGMAQIFFFTAYFLTFLIKIDKSRLVRIILLLGGLLTFSTGGLLSFLGANVVLFFYPRHRLKINFTKFFIILIGLPILISAVFFMPDFGILAKANSISGQERIKSYRRSWNSFLENPLFGQGFFKDFEKERESSSYVDTLGLIGFIYQLGVVGIILYLLPWLYSFHAFNNSKTYFVLMPCFLTLLFSQPSYIDMIVWLLLFVDFSALVDESALPMSHRSYKYVSQIKSSPKIP